MGGNHLPVSAGPPCISHPPSGGCLGAIFKNEWPVKRSGRLSSRVSSNATAGSVPAWPARRMRLELDGPVAP